MAFPMRVTRAIVHLDSLEANIRAIRRQIGPERRLCVAVKADAYGHGAVPVSTALLAAGATHLAVATVDEGAELRNAGIGAPILMLSPPSPEEVDATAALELEAFLSDPEEAAGLSAAAGRVGKRLPVHIKVDTGMGRVGCAPEGAVDLARAVCRLPGLRLAGTATHLSVADSATPDDRSYTEGQLRSFAGAVEAIRAAGIDPGLVHAANSGGIIQHPESLCDMVRAGILAYGYLPDDALEGAMDLVPVMELESRISLVKRVRAGDYISYGRMWRAPRDTWIATVPVGYADGLPRRLSGQYRFVGERGARPQVGRICMDQCMVDLGPEEPWERWGRVAIFGPDPRGQNAADLARLAGTIPYEITCGISKRVPRIYVR